MFAMGTRSLLIGAHWPLHNLMVVAAWRYLYGSWPTWRELVAIGLHDLGYLGCREMDGPDGTMHPEAGARLADRMLGREYGDLIRGHSKGYAETIGVPLSRLYGPDKCSHAFESVRCYVLRTRLTGEIRQYRATTHGCAPRNDAPAVTDHEWFRVVRNRMIRGGTEAAVKAQAPDGLGLHRGR